MGYFAFFQLFRDNRLPRNTIDHDTASSSTDWFSESRNETQRTSKGTLCFLHFHTISVSIKTKDLFMLGKFYIHAEI